MKTTHVSPFRLGSDKLTTGISPELKMVLLMLTNRGRIKEIFRHFMRYLFSHIGLFCLCGAYCVGGAYLFAFIENPGVISRIRDTVNISHKLENQRQNMIDILVQHKCASDFGDILRNIFNHYQKTIADAIQNHSYIGEPQEEDDIQNGWVFPSALLFTISVVTTIGYGHVTPKTALGQMMVIPYSLLGIPLMLMFLANVGEFMARCFRLGYTRCCCFVCWRRRKRNFQLDKDRRAKAKDAYMGDVPSGDVEVQNDAPKPDRAHSPSVNSDLSEEFPHEVPDDEFLNVPISLTILVAVTYLFIGAILFATWNGWTWIQGAYFSFITLATIGFGDFIPGWHEVGTTIGNVKLVISCLYIVFGLAVLSMSFNLMMDEMIAKFKWLGRQLGIIRKENKPTEPTQSSPLPETDHSTPRIDAKSEDQIEDLEDPQKTNP